MAGTIIPASLITGLNSDLPGRVIAQVTENVYDTPTGQISCSSRRARASSAPMTAQVAFGQQRALVVWQRIIMPDGSSIVIDNLPATDTAGYAGLEDEVEFPHLAAAEGDCALDPARRRHRTDLRRRRKRSGQGDCASSAQDSANQAGQKHHRAQSQHPADHHHPARLAASHHRAQGHGAPALSPAGGAQ